MRATTTIAIVAALISPANARLDVSRASVERLDNGLTLILLEDKSLPVVSIQTVYRTGAKDDPAGRLGLAHFSEHMAFRGSKNFPDTGLVSSIYAVGGEWHGYTWIDLTTYFATTPKEDLGLLLEIEADRMARLDVRAEDVDAERGAVLAEMNGYLNDPDSTLFDALMAAHFLTHPYRNNTIGYAGDINAISHDDLAEFYRRHYAPQNAIIAIAGDFERQTVRAAVRKKFGKISKPIDVRAPMTAEMPRTGERRIRLSLPADEKLFKIAYPAPAASQDDFPAFLVLQAILGGSAGANFNQNDWGTPVAPNSPLAKARAGIRTWVIPTAEPYAFVVSGAAPEKSNEKKIEQAIQRAFDKLASEPVPDSALSDAKNIVRAALAFDVDTTEEAAHQLAYFAGIGALDQLLRLEGRIGAVTAKDVAAIAGNYLRGDQRTIAWLSPGAPSPAALQAVAKSADARDGAPFVGAAIGPTSELKTVSGAKILFQPSELSPTYSVKVAIDGRFECDACAIDDPAFGLTSISASAVSDRPDDAYADILQAIAAAKPSIAAAAPSSDPMTRLEDVFAAAFPANRAAKNIVVAAVSGETDCDAVKRFADALPARAAAPQNVAPPILPPSDIDIVLDEPKAQNAVGYMAAAPAANDEGALAMRIALYVISHGYEGRLGKEAITRRGLAYYIDAQYLAGADGGIVTLSSGVDPDKTDAFRALMKTEISRLQSEPPTDAEIAEAKKHLIGRKISGSQSNAEIADALVRDFLAAGAAESPTALAGRLENVDRQNVLDAIKALQNGVVVTVRGGGVD